MQLFRCPGIDGRGSMPYDSYVLMSCSPAATGLHYSQHRAVDYKCPQTQVELNSHQQNTRRRNGRSETICPKCTCNCGVRVCARVCVRMCVFVCVNACVCLCVCVYVCSYGAISLPPTTTTSAPSPLPARPKHKSITLPSAFKGFNRQDHVESKVQTALSIPNPVPSQPEAQRRETEK